MRNALILLLLAIAALSGCLDSDSPPADEGDTGPADSDGDGVSDEEEQAAGSDPADASSVPTPPEPLHFEGSAIGTGTGLDPVCAIPQLSCRDHAFNVPTGGWLVTITLLDVQGPAGGVQPTDYDLYITDSAGNAAGEATNPGGEANVVAARLAPGDYNAQVFAWNDQGGSYTLDIVFS